MRRTGQRWRHYRDFSHVFLFRFCCCTLFFSLPVDDADFLRSHTRLLIKPLPYPNPDAALPKSDTCFFNLSVPAYSSKKILRDKMLYAINSDTSMNSDWQTLRENENEQNRHQRRQAEEDVYEEE